MWAKTPSPVGELTLVAGRRGLQAILWPPQTAACAAGLADLKPRPEHQVLQAATDQLAAYFAGQLHVFELELDLRGTPFQLQVWSLLQKIPYGQTWTYLELADRLGDRHKARAAGAANGNNPLAIVVPCHRVVGQGGELTGYAGGLAAKSYLLQLEQGETAAPALQADLFGALIIEEMAMHQAKITLHRDFVVAPLDERLYGAFIEHLGRAIYGGLYEPGHPSADEHGFRGDVLEAVRQLHVPILRYPGGNFVSGYNWEDGVGPPAQRPKGLDLAWRTTESNQFGTNEFVLWCQQADIEPMLAINMGTRGVEAARQLVESCNHPGGSYWSDLRVAHGFKQPHGVKVWCLGNEMDGPWQIGHKTATEYGRLARECAKVMKWVDPSIELVVCGSSNRGMGSFATWEAEVLEHTYDQVDYLSLHTYFGNRDGNTAHFLAQSVGMDAFIGEVVAACDFVRARGRHKKAMMLSFDEWNVWYHSNQADREVTPWSEAPAQLEDNYTFEDALVVGCMLITLIKRADRVRMGCMAQLVNAIAPILTATGGGLVRQTIFYPYLHASLYGRGTALDLRFESPTYEDRELGPVPYLEAVAVVDEPWRTATVFAVNRSLADELVIEGDLRGLGACRVVETWAMTCSDLKACNTLQAPERVVPGEGAGARLAGGRLEVVLSPASWNVIRLELQEA